VWTFELKKLSSFMQVSFLIHYNEMIIHTCNPYFLLALATVQGYTAAVQVGTNPEAPVQVMNHQATWTEWLVLGCYPDHTWIRGYLAGLKPDRGSNCTVRTTLTTIKYMSSDHIVIRSVYRLFSSSRSFPSRFQFSDPTDIRWVAVK